MEAIKCPVCGSAKVQELTEDKYVCLACENQFRLPSKDSKQVEEHISINITSSADDTRVKEILFEAEENLENGNYNEAFVLFKKYNSLMPDSDEGYDGMCRTILLEAEDNLANGNYAGAYARFKDYTTWEPDSYVGYEGMYRTASCTNVIRTENDLYNGFDVLKKALECEDCDKEELLEPILKEFQSLGDKVFYEKLTEEVRTACSNAKLPQTDLVQNMQQLIETHEDEKKKKEEKLKRIRVYSQEGIQNYNNLSEKDEEDRIKKAFQQIKIYSQERTQNYNNLSEKEKENRIKKELLPPIILFLLGLFVFPGLLSIVSIVVSLIWAFIKFMLNGKPWEVAIFDSLSDQIDEEQQQIDHWKNNLERLNSRTALQISDMEEIICNEYTKGLPADAKKYRVVLTEAGINSVLTLQVVRELINPNYEEAQNIVNSVPIAIMDYADEELADRVKAKFVETGAKVTLIQQN